MSSRPWTFTLSGFKIDAIREEQDCLYIKAQSITLTAACPSCHHKAEQNVRMRSGLAGLAYVLGNLAPLFLMCDAGDLGTDIEPVENQTFGGPTVVLYDSVPAGIGFSERLFEIHDELIARAFELVRECPCADGCPSCVGPGGENGYGGKQEALAILGKLTNN